MVNVTNIYTNKKLNVIGTEMYIYTTPKIVNIKIHLK